MSKTAFGRERLQAGRGSLASAVADGSGGRCRKSVSNTQALHSAHRPKLTRSWSEQRVTQRAPGPLAKVRCKKFDMRPRREAILALSIGLSGAPTNIVRFPSRVWRGIPTQSIGLRQPMWNATRAVSIIALRNCLIVFTDMTGRQYGCGTAGDYLYRKPQAHSDSRLPQRQAHLHRNTLVDQKPGVPPRG